jgi:DNA-binding LacI/PurR family transcriptional regulator
VTLKAAFCSNQTNPFYDSVLRALATRLATEPGVELMEWEGRSRFPLAAIRYLHPDVVFVGAFNQPEREHIPADCLVLGFSNALETTDFPRVVNHDREVGRLAGHALLQAGYNRWMVFVDNDAYHAHQRVAGIREVAEPEGIPVHLLNVSLRKLAPHETFQHMWKEHAASLEHTLRNLKPNTGILATSALSASEVLETLAEFSSLNIPEDLGVIVTDFPQMNEQNLAHVALDATGVARGLVDLVLKHRNGDTLPLITALNQVNTVWGKTLRAVPKG